MLSIGYDSIKKVSTFFKKINSGWLSKSFSCRCLVQEKEMEKDSDLVDAARSGDSASIDPSIVSAATLSRAYFESSDTCILHAAIRTNRETLIRRILKKGVDVNQMVRMNSELRHLCLYLLFYLQVFVLQNGSRQTALHVACTYGNLRAVKWLIAGAADKHAIDQVGSLIYKQILNRSITTILCFYYI